MRENLYDAQYNLTYKLRLSKLRKRIPVFDKWGIEPLPSIINITSGVKCAIIGTLFVSSNLKPSIFKELSGNNKEMLSYCSESNKYFLEDDTGRIEVQFEDTLPRGIWPVTGMVVGLLGQEINNGKFIASDISIPGYIRPIDSKGNGIICLISGLELSAHTTIKLKILLDYINGCFTTPINITEFILLGNTATNISDFDTICPYFNKKITIIPDLKDPSSNIFPIQPLHKKLFKYSIESFSNPSFVTIGKKSFLFCSNIFVKDLIKYNPDMDYLSAMEFLLQLQCVGPTAPDTIMCTPSIDKPDFIIENGVNYFILSSESTFVHRKFNNTSLFCLPKFSRTGEVIILNLEDDSYKIIKVE
ncbi:DNA polymerase subunit delta-2 [Astathelohania contejeani]|uniref:DNA polymerase subunit delta-2 n=1 Tax=Astathelohania contejeani TaxID=164912 RepID=A0ABQ7HWL9_9MICR|nr:DNA polymerase subunit delta-2 [Thelohania contejeani]